MIIEKTPEQYCGAYQDVIFKISQINPSNIAEVGVYDNNNILIAMKRFSREREHNVNVGKYVVNKITVEPIKYKTGFYQTGERVAELKIIAYEIEVDTENGEERTIQTERSKNVKLTAGAKQSEIGKGMSDNNTCVVIEINEYDEIPFIAPQSEITATLQINTTKGIKTISYKNQSIQNGEMGVFIVDINDILQNADIQDIDEVHSIEVAIKDTENKIAERKYIIQNENYHSVRCAWVNEYGAIDYYTFKALQSEKIKSIKKKVYGQSGYTVNCSQAENFIEIASEPLTEEQYKWISKIICAPKVWIIENETTIPVDITTETLEYSPHKLSKIDLTLRQIERDIFQRG